MNNGKINSKHPTLPKCAPFFLSFIYIISYLAKSSDAQCLAEDVMANLHLDDDDDDDDDGDDDEVEWFNSLKKRLQRNVHPNCLSYLFAR